MQAAKRYICYLSGDSKRLTDWPGGELARVTYTRESRHNWARHITHVWATDPQGGRWYGKGSGAGMAIIVRRLKG